MASVHRRDRRGLRRLGVAPVGGFLDAIGGGWGPIVTSTLVAQGERARHAIGSGSVGAFLVTAARLGDLPGGPRLAAYGRITLGPIVGGTSAAPFADWFGRILPQRVLMGAVSVVVGGLGIYGLAGLLGGA